VRPREHARALRAPRRWPLRSRGEPAAPRPPLRLARLGDVLSERGEGHVGPEQDERGGPEQDDAPHAASSLTAGAEGWVTIFAASSSSTAGCSRSHSTAFSRPWPIRSPLRAKWLPDFSTRFKLVPRSSTSPARLMPVP